MLTWTVIECWQAATKGGEYVYRICPSFGPTPPAAYVAVLSYRDGRNRLFESIIGWFPTIGAAKVACETDLKSYA